MTYFNENDPYPAQWLRNLYPDATVDERSIVDVRADDVRGATRAHFFAGIAGWEYALQLAGWPGDLPVWTGSCPCQPFSAAGRKRGTADERHLWPELLRLIRECRPPVVFGEQVASRLGREWLAGVRADMEALGYAVGAADLCAASVGAPHIRQRLYWVANRYESGPQGRVLGGVAGHKAENASAGRDEACSMVDPNCSRCGGRVSGPIGDGSAFCGGVGNTNNCAGERLGTQRRTMESEQAPKRSRPATPWSLAAAVRCSDGKERRFEPGIHPLAHGVPARVGRLRAYGNAIVPQVAAAFVTAFMECAI